jgi:hypothetical protein
MTDLSALQNLSPEELEAVKLFGQNQGATDPKQLPGKPQVWKVDNKWYVAYMIPGTSTPMVWETTTVELAEKFGGVDAQAPAPDKTMSTADFQALSPWLGGRINEIRNTSDDPWTQFFSDFNQSADLRPWLRDPDMLATIASAFLEGRTPTADELSQTEWWQNHSAKEREWLETSVTLGGKELERRRGDARRLVTNQMLGAGLTNVGQKAIDLIADKWLTGEWSEDYVAEQVRKLADPFAPGELNKAISDRTSERMETTRKEEDSVRDMAVQWLGPTMGVMAQTDVERWAGRLRNNPNAKIEFEEFLRKQRMTMFPGYENPNLTYEDIVQPVRNMVGNVWGRPAEDETMLVDLANLQDYGEMQKRLRKKGLDQGIGKVVSDALDELGGSSLGEQVVRSTL